MKITRHVTLRLQIILLALLLGACSSSQSLCRGPLRPINVHAPPVQGWSP